MPSSPWGSAASGGSAKVHSAVTRRGVSDSSTLTLPLARIKAASAHMRVLEGAVGQTAGQGGSGRDVTKEKKKTFQTEAQRGRKWDTKAWLGECARVCVPPSPWRRWRDEVTSESEER